MSSLKLLWLPGPFSYRLRAFAGANTQTRVFAGELVLEHAAARQLHAVLELGIAELGQPVDETGWQEPTLSHTVVN